MAVKMERVNRKQTWCKICAWFFKHGVYIINPWTEARPRQRSGLWYRVMSNFDSIGECPMEILHTAWRCPRCRLANANLKQCTAASDVGKYCGHLSLRFNGHFLGEPGLVRCQIITINKLISIFFTDRMPFLSPNQQCQSTEGKISHSMDLLTPSSPGGLPTLSLTTNSSRLPWGRVAMPLISPLMPVPHPRRRLANANLKQCAAASDVGEYGGHPRGKI